MTYYIMPICHSFIFLYIYIKVYKKSICYKRVWQKKGIMMINYIWFLLIFIGILTGIITGNVQAVTDAAIQSAKTAVELSIGMIGMMSLWLGIMKIAEKSGLINKISHILKPFL